jgi:hypothetical protein
MNTLYTQYVNEARVQQYQQALQQQAATERALRAARREQAQEAVVQARLSYPRLLLLQRQPLPLRVGCRPGRRVQLSFGGGAVARVLHLSRAA